MTPEEINALPNPPFTPIRDMVLCQRLKQNKIGSIYLPDEKTIQDQVCRVLQTGPGLMLDSGAIRSAPCSRGDKIFCTPNDGMRIVLDDQEYYLYEAMEITGVITDENVTVYGEEHC